MESGGDRSGKGVPAAPWHAGAASTPCSSLSSSRPQSRSGQRGRSQPSPRFFQHHRFQLLGQFLAFAGRSDAPA